MARAHDDHDIREGKTSSGRDTIGEQRYALVRKPKKRIIDGLDLVSRFLTAEGALTDVDPSGFMFGFGWRVCPGRHTADASLWTTIATMLATLEFTLAKDPEGNEIMFEPKYVNGITHQPAIFPCRISPRSHVSKASLERAR
ncbi:hypothetical protein PAXINDRAFT_16208 [Paxillus involutus ATCC 200175]|uniref:Cytochrome P450 n=1 Tax=Paxillus involutus ATCC 200175 TaxID=664439 RepID=A0A0C9T536_PAXIN|nr:hypothetical protein PAXINDRAFT_16208 [Paxillus involutus ATCC 200175]